MLFNSIDFCLFFPIVLIGFYTLPHKWRSLFLLVASYIFYMFWQIEYLILIIVSTLIDYCVGLRMEAARTKRERKKYLLVSIISNLGILFVFKYYNFFSESAYALLTQLGFSVQPFYLKLILPLGISFYTFQTMSYSIDIYNQVRKPEKNLFIFALYVSYFPQLVAGPIERSTRLLPQLNKKINCLPSNITSGIKLMMWGFFKKLVIADRLAFVVNTVYHDPTQYTGWPLIIATYAFAFQIYYDFSGYSDIAIGAARTMGIRVMKNFDQPYLAKSIPEFWRRWHISLSTWFRDYVYFPSERKPSLYKQGET